MPDQRKIRIGIDVGGTFTHAVAVDAATLRLVGRSKVPTTHTAAEGVARGVVDSLLALLKQCGVVPDEVMLIAHSTTQATNALLEGDVATVGIVGMARGAGTWLARRQTAIRPIPLAPGRFLHTHHEFIHSDRVTEQTVHAAIDALVRKGAEVIVAAEAFSVDDP
ncbi:MAG: hydantoinase, partial [Phycisphaerae bacterium]|nr:hydantoinase [Phycisphaerae bacterium]